jgi:hypothetical protein
MGHPGVFFGKSWVFTPLDGYYIVMDGKVNEIMQKMKQTGPIHPHIQTYAKIVSHCEKLSILRKNQKC